MEVMETLKKISNEAEHYYPYVMMDPETGICEIAGESYMEEPAGFYRPIIEWLDLFIKQYKGRITFNIKLHYFNTSSSRMLLIILAKLKEFEHNKGQLEVSWFYPAGDIDIEEEIDDFSSETGVKIKKIEV